MKEQILSIASDLREGSMTTNEAKECLLRLFNGEPVCQHEWYETDNPTLNAKSVINYKSEVDRPGSHGYLNVVTQ